MTRAERKTERAAPTIRQIESLAKKLGVDFKVNTATDMDAQTQRGKRFQASGCHSVVASGWDDDTAAEVRAMMLRDLQAGLYDCDDPGCEYCFGVDDDDEEVRR